jgi:cell division protein FtsZ
VRVTVIAAGFDGGAPRARAHEPRRAQIREPEPVDEFDEDEEFEDETVDLVSVEEPQHVRVREPAPRPPAMSRPQAPRRTIVFDDNDELDVPDFLK